MRHRHAIKADAARIPFRAGPFMQMGHAAGSSMAPAGEYVIWWFDPAPQEHCTVLWGDRPDRRLMTSLPEEPGGDGRRHQVRLSGLEAGRAYYYAIPAWGNAIHSFVAAPGASQPVRLLCLGDTENTAADRDTLSYGGEVLGLARTYYGARGAPHCMLHLGDLVKFGNDLKAWSDFFTDIAGVASMTPFMAALGNHELKGDGGSHYDYFFSHPRDYSVDVGSVHVLVLDPFDGPFASEDGPRLGSSHEQFEFARRDLKKNRDKKWIVVALHAPLLSTGDFHVNRYLVGQYFSLFRRNRVDLVISGHDHSFDSFLVDGDRGWGGTWHIVCGTGGSRLDSYIMTRKNNPWKDWAHDRNSPSGLYGDNSMIEKYHIYGELSWGFVDLVFQDNEMIIAYHRWLSFPRFLEITGQDAASWKIVPLKDSRRKKHGLDRSEAVLRYTKKRNFN
jgi:hypothetical protein